MGGLFLCKGAYALCPSGRDQPTRLDRASVTLDPKNYILINFRVPLKTALKRENEIAASDTRKADEAGLTDRPRCRGAGINAGSIDVGTKSVQEARIEMSTEGQSA